MNASIRRITLLLALAFAILFANLNYVQLVRSEDLSTHPFNDRDFIEKIGRRRGEIIAADGTILARSVPFDDQRFTFRRRYPLKDLTGHITGFYAPSRLCRSSGLEESYDDFLIGDSPPVLQDWVDELLGRQREGNVLRVSLIPGAQRAAARALGDQRGAVAAIDPETGAVLALYSTPGYNPNRITRDHPDTCGDIKAELEEQDGNPLRFKAIEDRFPPGSTFKVITAAAALEDGMKPSTSFPVRRSLDLPDSDKDLTNFGNSSCGGTLANALRVSCNTAFGEIGLRLGANKMATMARRFGFDRPLTFDLPTVRSCVDAIPGGDCGNARNLARPFVALSAIGQFNVGVSALQMARVMATVANGGRVPQPYLVTRIESEEGEILSETAPQLSRRIYSKRTADQLKQMLVDVVRSGTGAVVGFREASSGRIGGKTGTAETGGPDDPPHVWFVAFAPDVAVAVVVENGGDLRFSATGGRVAGPIAKAVLEKLRGHRNR